MRRGMTNYLQIRVNDMDLTTCTNLVLMVEQSETTYTFTGTADQTDTELMNVTIPKNTALNFRGMPAKVQVALTDADGIPRSHNPINVCIGDLLEVNGYGS